MRKKYIIYLLYYRMKTPPVTEKQTQIQELNLWSESWAPLFPAMSIPDPVSNLGFLSSKYIIEIIIGFSHATLLFLLKTVQLCAELKTQRSELAFWYKCQFLILRIRRAHFTVSMQFSQQSKYYYLHIASCGLPWATWQAHDKGEIRTRAVLICNLVCKALQSTSYTLLHHITHCILYTYIQILHFKKVVLQISQLTSRVCCGQGFV